MPYTAARPSEPSTPDDVADLDNPLPSATADLPCSAAVEFLADIYEKEGGTQIQTAVEVRALHAALMNVRS